MGGGVLAGRGASWKRGAKYRAQRGGCSPHELSLVGPQAPGGLGPFVPYFVYDSFIIPPISFLQSKKKWVEPKEKTSAHLALPNSGSRRRLARNSLRSDSRARIPAATHLHCPFGAGKTSNGRRAVPCSNLNMQTCSSRCEDFLCTQAREYRRVFFGIFVISTGRTKEICAR